MRPATQSFGQRGDLCTQIQRRHDFAARIGGDEFAVLLPETNLNSAAGVAERLRYALEHMPILASGDSFYVTVSLGVTEVCPETDDVETFLARADRGLYSAKRGGRNRVAMEGPVQ